jgi:hypothetical protein
MRCEAVRHYLLCANADPLGNTEVAAHLRSCERCSSWVRRLELADQCLSEAMQDVPVPSNLKSRILRRLQRDRIRALQRWLVPLTSAAASVLVAFGLYYSVLGLPPPIRTPTVDFGEVPVGVPDLNDAEAVERWLLDTYSITMPSELRHRWDFQYHTALFVERQDEEEILTMRFHRDGGEAIVQLIPRGQPRVPLHARQMLLGEHDSSTHIGLVTFSERTNVRFLQD